jgi:hypothetical protein
MSKKAEELAAKAAELRSAGKTEEADRLAKQATAIRERAARIGKGDRDPEARKRERRERFEARGDNRDKRRAASIQRLHKRWGAALENEQAVAELRLTARRTAYLRRIAYLAEEAGNEELARRTRVLMTRERQRHHRAMQQFGGADTARGAGRTRGPEGRPGRDAPPGERPEPTPTPEAEESAE